MNQYAMIVIDEYTINIIYKNTINIIYANAIRLSVLRDSIQTTYRLNICQN